MTRLLRIALLAALSLLCGVGSASAQTVTVTANWGAENSCTVCGFNDYACSDDTGSWFSGLNGFSDPVPGGALVTGVSVTLFGVADSATTQVSLSGEQVGAVQNYLPPFECDACTPLTFTESQPGGWPGYSYGGTVTLAVTSTNGATICLDRAEVTLTYVAGGGDDDDDDDDDDSTPADDDDATAGDDDDATAGDDDDSGGDDDDNGGGGGGRSGGRRGCSAVGAVGVVGPGWLGLALLGVGSARRRRRG